MADCQPGLPPKVHEGGNYAQPTATTSALPVETHWSEPCLGPVAKTVPRRTVETRNWMISTRNLKSLLAGI